MMVIENPDWQYNASEYIKVLYNRLQQGVVRK